MRILNYALTLEYLEAAFYKQALLHGGAPAWVERFCRPRSPAQRR